MVTGMGGGEDEGELGCIELGVLKRQFQFVPAKKRVSLPRMLKGVGNWCHFLGGDIDSLAGAVKICGWLSTTFRRLPSFVDGLAERDGPHRTTF